MEIKEHILLAPYTTFKIGGPAKYFCEANDQFDALSVFDFATEKGLPVLVMGGGSNVLISDRGFNGIVVRVISKGIEVIFEDKNSVLLKISSGENWDEAVKFAVKNNWWGIENLSHIPGSAGAIAVQNVGAYGQEAKNVIEQVTAFNKKTRQITGLSREDCNFAYRSSIFNTTEKGEYIIFNINFRLSKNPNPVLEYRDLKNKFLNKNPSLEYIRQAVIEIRNKKFPFPYEAKNGNAGSFFKNPVLTKVSFQSLLNTVAGNFGSEKAEMLESKKFTENGNFKVPAAFLVELCGLKDEGYGGAAINHNQPLVIINKTGNATAKDVLALAEKVRQTVLLKTGIILDFEPELVGF